MAGSQVVVKRKDFIVGRRLGIVLVADDAGGFRQCLSAQIEGRFAGHQLIKQYAQRVHITRGGNRQARNLFRTRVIGSQGTTADLSQFGFASLPFGITDNLTLPRAATVF